MALPASELARLVRRGAEPWPSSQGDPDRAEGPGPLALGGAPGWSDVDAALPDGGLPRGAVVEVASVLGLGRSTSFAVAACAAAQKAAAAWSREANGGWCAWVDPWGTLHAPGLRAGGVELERLLVVRPPLPALARTAVRVASSATFAVVVIDTAWPLGLAGDGVAEEPVRLDRWPTVVRRLALAVEGSETTVLLLTDLATARGLPLPVALRIELERRRDGDGCSRSYLRVAKERQGRVRGPVAV